MAPTHCSRSIKLETPEVAVKASAAAFFNFWVARTPDLATAVPNVVERIDLVEGQWGKPGCVILWHYFIDGNKELSKELMEVIDYEKKYATYKQVEGHLVDLYKSLICHLNVTAKTEGSSVRWIVEYEKRNETDPDPLSLIDLLVELNKAVDAYLTEKA